MLVKFRFQFNLVKPLLRCKQGSMDFPYNDIASRFRPCCCQSLSFEEYKLVHGQVLGEVDQIQRKAPGSLGTLLVKHHISIND